MTRFFGSIQKIFHSCKLLFLSSHHENSEFVLIWKKKSLLQESFGFDKSIIWWAATEVFIKESPLNTDKKLFLQNTTVRRNYVKSSANLNEYLKDIAL